MQCFMRKKVTLCFHSYNVLRKSDSLEDMGTIQWHLVLSNFIGWAIVVASLIKGVQSLGKASMTYVIIMIINNR